MLINSSNGLSTGNTITILHNVNCKNYVLICRHMNIIRLGSISTIGESTYLSKSVNGINIYVHTNGNCSNINGRRTSSKYLVLQTVKGQSNK